MITLSNIDILPDSFERSYKQPYITAIVCPETCSMISFVAAWTASWTGTELFELIFLRERRRLKLYILSTEIVNTVIL